MEFEKIEKQRQLRRENEKKELSSMNLNSNSEQPVRQSRRERIAAEEARGIKPNKKTANSDLVQNQELLDQIARLNKNRAQMRESLNKTKSGTKQSKH